jgi:hypothetical protein
MRGTMEDTGRHIVVRASDPELMALQEALEQIAKATAAIDEAHETIKALLNSRMEKDH